MIYTKEEFEKLLDIFSNENANLTNETSENDSWDDPGDYPNGASSGPLPSEYWVNKSATYKPTTQIEFDKLTPEMIKELIEVATEQIKDALDNEIEDLEVLCEYTKNIVEFLAEWQEGMPDFSDE